MDRIIDFTGRFSGMKLEDHVTRFLIAAQRNMLMPTNVRLGNPRDLADAPIAAEIRADHVGGKFGTVGRWCVMCDQCPNGEYANLSDPRFMCTSCFNGQHGYRWRPVLVPEEREEIEHLLLMRPPSYRHWLPGETAADLRVQNLVLGVGV